jgi:hypothetical protein
MNNVTLKLAGTALIMLLIGAVGGYWAGQRPAAETETPPTLLDTDSAAVTRRSIVVVGTVTEVKEDRLVVAPLNGETETVEVPVGVQTAMQLTAFADGAVQAPVEAELSDISPGDRVDATVNIYPDDRVETPSVSIWRGDQSE